MLRSLSKICQQDKKKTVIGFDNRATTYNVSCELIKLMYYYIAGKMAITVKNFYRIIQAMAIGGSTKADLLNSIKEYEDFVGTPDMCVKGGAQKMMDYLKL